MSPRLRRLSGRQVVAILRGFGFEEVSQRGSHAKLRRVTETGAKQTLTVPLHDQLDSGTTAAIYRQARVYISESDLRSHFYTD